MCRLANVIKVKERNGNIEITFNEKGIKILTNRAENEKMLLEFLAEKYKNSIRFVTSEKPYMILYVSDRENRVEKIKDFLETVGKNSNDEN